MRGASALEQALAEQPGKRVQALVVWMPVIATDLGPPTTDKMALLPDRRVAQFWDPKHIISRTLAASARAHPDWLTPDEKAELSREGLVIWDYVAVFPPGVRWDREAPRPDFRGGPVVKVMDGLRQRLAQ